LPFTNWINSAEKRKCSLQKALLKKGGKMIPSTPLQAMILRFNSDFASILQKNSFFLNKNKGYHNIKIYRNIISMHMDNIKRKFFMNKIIPAGSITAILKIPGFPFIMAIAMIAMLFGGISVFGQTEDSGFIKEVNEVETTLPDDTILAQNTTTGQPGTASTKSDMSGFAESPWMSEFSKVRETLRNLATSETASEKVEILAVEKNKYILVKRNGVSYRYNFYQTPLNVLRLSNHDLTEEEYSKQEAVLYQVKIIIPFIDSASIKGKIVARYGQNNRSTVNEKSFRGADIWEMTGGYLFQWYEPYKNRAYTRTIDLVSVEMAKRIIKEYEDYFDSEEKEVLQKIIIR
jgi:hypothetical protein